MSDELMIKKERVLEAAKILGCEEKRLLKALFPEAFKNSKPKIDLTKLQLNPETLTTNPSQSFFWDAKEAGFPDGLYFSVREAGEYKDRAFCLDWRYDWRIKRDNGGVLVLIPSHKEYDDSNATLS